MVVLNARINLVLIGQLFLVPNCACRMSERSNDPLAKVLWAVQRDLETN